MIICRVKNEAGLGNQMFMYAFVYDLAREKQSEDSSFIRDKWIFRPAEFPSLSEY